MKIYVVMDLVYGAEGSPGVKLYRSRAYRSKASADAEEARLIAEDPQDGTYLVVREECDLED